MQTQNPFLDFAEKMITRYSGFGHAFDPALMVYLEDEGMPGKEEQPLSQNVITNLYNIQNIKEENYLYRQNLSFLTQILEKRLYQNLYPSVQKQIEKVVREEMPQTNDRIVETFSQQMYRLIKQGGINQFEVLKEQISSEIVEKEKMISKEYDVLLRKIENVWNSSFYGNVLNRVDRMETQVIYPTSQITMMFPEIKEVLEKKETFDKNEYLKKKERFDKSEYLEKKENFLEKTIFLIQRQEQMHMLKRLQSVGNLGMAYNHLEVLRDADVHMEYLTESNHAEAFVSEKSGQQKADIYPGGITQENAINQNLNTERIWEKKKLRVRELAEKELIERQLFKRQQDGNNTVTISESTEKYVEKYLTEKLMKSHVEDIRQSRIVHRHI